MQGALIFHPRVMKTCIGLSLGLIFATSASAADVSLTAIFGTGNPDAGWTATSQGSLQLALRARNTVTGATPGNGAGVYTFAAGTTWNFDFSFNVNADGSGSGPLANYQFTLQVDTDPRAGQSFVTIDPSLYPDNSYGTGATANGGGVEGTFGAPNFLGATNTVMQGSQNLGFFPFLANPAQPGTYDFRISATLLQDQSIVAFPKPASAPAADPLSIRVVITDARVPDGGATVALFAGALGSLWMMGRGRRNSRSSLQPVA